MCKENVWKFAVNLKCMLKENDCIEKPIKLQKSNLPPNLVNILRKTWKAHSCNKHFLGIVQNYTQRLWHPIKTCKSSKQQS